MRSLATVVAAVCLLAAACSGETVDAPPITTGPDPSITAPDATASNDQSALPAPSTMSAPVDSGAAAAGLPPLGEGAAGAFDAGYLNLGPGADFPALDDPAFIPASDVWWLEPDSVVLGVVNGEEAQAYPVDQMAYHHLANTTVAGEPFLVTY